MGDRERATAPAARTALAVVTRRDAAAMRIAERLAPPPPVPVPVPVALACPARAGKRARPDRDLAAERLAMAAALDERLAAERRWSLDKRARFLAALAESGLVAKAARAAAMSASGAYALRRRDAAFAAMWDDACRQFIDLVEASVLDRVVNGYDKPVFHRGKATGSQKVFGDPLAVHVLKTRRPEVYGEPERTPTALELLGRAGEEARLLIESRLADISVRMGDRLE